MFTMYLPDSKSYHTLVKTLFILISSAVTSSLIFSNEMFCEMLITHQATSVSCFLE